MQSNLGHGQYGKVHLAKNENDMNNLIAVKVIERHLHKNKESIIQSEIENQKSIVSENVVQLTKAIKTDSRIYIFMDYCNGGDLKEFMEIKNQTLSPEIIRRIMV